MTSYSMAGAAFSAYRLCSPLLPGLLRLLFPLSRKLKTFADVRTSLFSDLERKLQAMPEHSCRIWIHASSVGEFEQARPIITELKRRIPDAALLVSFLSDSGYNSRKDFPGASAVFYLPLDTPLNARRLVSLLKPDVFMLMQYDFWPNHLEAIKQSGAFMILAAATISPGSIRLNPLFKGFYRDIFMLFDQVYAITTRDRDLFRSEFGCSNALQAGDPRFDQVMERSRMSDARASRMKPLFSRRTVLVAGSTWKKDEELLTSAWLPYRDRLSLVLVPHDVSIENIERIGRYLAGKNLAFEKISTLSAEFDPSQTILLVDQIGYLAELYTIASIAYVGGGFLDNVHSTIEPAVYGIPVLFGPKYDKSPEAVGLLESGAASVVTGMAELSDAIRQLIDDPKLLRETGKRASAFVENRLGATEIIAAGVNTCIVQRGAKNSKYKT